MGVFSDVLLVTDYDDTLTGPGAVPKEPDGKSRIAVIPQANTDALKAFAEEGGLFTIASGRPRMFYESVIAPKIRPNAPLILSNGAYLYDAQKMEDVMVCPLPDTAKQAAAECMKFFPGVTIEAHRTDTVCVIHCAPWDTQHRHVMGFAAGDIESFEMPWLKLLFLGEHNEITALMSYLAQKYPDMDGVESVPVVCELQAAGVTKGNAARWLANRLGRRRLVCIGDAPNDLTMLEEADYAFVAQSGNEAVKAMGFRIAAPSRIGTVADAIAQMRAILREEERRSVR